MRPQPSRSFSEAVRAWLQWFGLARLVVTAGAVLAVGGGGFWLLQAPPTAVETSLPYAKGSASAPSLGTSTAAVVRPASTIQDATVIIVHVAGAVVAPGVYELPPSSRLHQAIFAAGGLVADADQDVLNLASALHDGDRVFVPHLGQSLPGIIAPTGANSSGLASSATSGPVDLNRATTDDLDALPGVGPATAAAIVSYRDQHGPFATVDDLLKVRGIGPAKLDAMRTLVTT